MTCAAPLFEFDDVRVEVESTTVLRGVTACIEDGAVLTCLLGPSGSGKSTLLRLCNRLDVPTSGSVRFRGRPLDRVDVLAHRRTVGMVFQRPTLFPGTVRDNLLVADPTLDRDRMVDVLQRADVDPDLIDRDGGALSGGEAQRVCLARTLVTGPEVLLMDEPTSALDPDATRRLESLGRSIVAAGTPVVWVTHDIAQSDRICDRRLVLTDGRVADADESRAFLTGADVEDGSDDGER